MAMVTIADVVRLADLQEGPFTSVGLVKGLFTQEECKNVSALCASMCDKKIFMRVGKTGNSALMWRTDGKSAVAMHKKLTDTLTERRTRGVGCIPSMAFQPKDPPTSFGYTFLLELMKMKPAKDHVRFFPT